MKRRSVFAGRAINLLIPFPTDLTELSTMKNKQTFQSCFSSEDNTHTYSKFQTMHVPSLLAETHSSWEKKINACESHEVSVCLHQNQKSTVVITEN